MSNKNKGILIFAIFYTVLFVFDGVKLLSYLLPSAIANYLKYLVYVVLALYGSFLCKDRLIQQWNEIRKTQRKFFFGILKGWLFLFLMTILFELLSSIFKAVFGTRRTKSKPVESSKHLSRPTPTDSSFCLHHWPFDGRTLFPSALIASFAETVARFTKHYSGRTYLCPESYA